MGRLIGSAPPPVVSQETCLCAQPDQPPGTVQSLNEKTLREIGAQNMADVLEQKTFAFIKRYGSSGLASISLRGTGASHTGVLLEGFRVTDPQLGQLDFSLLPTLALSHVEVIYGAGSALYGSDGIGGLVNLHLAEPRQTQASFLAEAGAFGYRRWGLRTAYGKAAHGSLIALEHTVDAGRFPYMDYAHIPPRNTYRENADRKQFSFYATTRMVHHTSQLNIGSWYVQAERGLPGPASTPPKGERQYDRAWRSLYYAFRGKRTPSSPTT